MSAPAQELRPIPEAIGPYVKLKPADFAEAQSLRSTNRIVGTYYFYWYDAGSKAHIVNHDGTDALTDRGTPLLTFRPTLRIVRAADAMPVYVRDRVALTIDEQGMAKTALRKLEVAKRLYAIAVDEYGLRPEDLVFDALTFTLGTGDPEFSNSAVETISAIRLIKSALPGVLTGVILGLER